MQYLVHSYIFKLLTAHPVFYLATLHQNETELGDIISY